MTIIEIQETNELVRAHAERGAEFIEMLKSYIDQEFPSHLITKSETPHALQYSYYGFRLIFRIEIEIANNNLEATLKAYSLSPDLQPVETFLGVKYTFDSLGNINRLSRPKEFSAFFIRDVFTKITGGGKIILRP
jgi:hypothetical protein